MILRREKVVLVVAVALMAIVADLGEAAWWEFWKERETMMGKKPVQKQAELKKAQAKVQSEVKKTSEVARAEKKSVRGTEEKGAPTVGVKEAEPIMEYKFDEEVVVVIFGEAKMTINQARTLGIKGLEQRKGFIPDNDSKIKETNLKY